MGNLNSGFYHSADLHDILGFDVGLKFAAVMVKDEDRVFDLVLPEQIKYGGVTLNAGVDYDKVIPGAPTALGSPSGKEVKVKASSPFAALRGQTIFMTPQGFDVKAVPLIMPQASIGLPFGLEVVGRFAPTLKVPLDFLKSSDVAKFSYMGLGVRHNIDQYISMMPINIAIHFMTQKLTISDMNDNKIVGASGTAYGIEVSKSLVLFTVYGGYQIEKSSWDVEPYKYADPTTATTIDIPGFSVDGQNTSRFHAGVRLLLLMVNVHADYSFAKQPVITAGLGISLR